MKNKKPVLKNCFEFHMKFPKNLLYLDIVYVDDSKKTSISLMRKFGIKYFKAHSLYDSSEFPDTKIVMGTIKLSEIEKWRRVFESMLELNSYNEEYNQACDSLRAVLIDQAV